MEACGHVLKREKKKTTGEKLNMNNRYTEYDQWSGTEKGISTKQVYWCRSIVLDA